MKNLALSLAMVFISMNIFAQKLDNNITVNGSHTYTIAPEYSSKVVVSLNNVYYDSQTMSMSEVKSGYLERLAKVGINSDRLTEDNLHYALLGYEKEGTVLVFKSNSLKELQQFLTVRSIGVLSSDNMLEAKLTEGQMADYSKAAFENAKSKASAIATKIGRTIGKAIYISDANTHKISESLYYNNTKNTRDYNISVSFELQ